MWFLCNFLSSSVEICFCIFLGEWDIEAQASNYDSGVLMLSRPNISRVIEGLYRGYRKFQFHIPYFSKDSLSIDLVWCVSVF